MYLPSDVQNMGIEVGMAWASAIAFTGAGLLALTVPQLIEALGPTKLLSLFAYVYLSTIWVHSVLFQISADLLRGLDAIALLCVWLVVPGTEQQIATMEEMNYVFGVTTRRHVTYQLEEVLPWYFNRYVRQLRLEDLAPLYRYSRLRDTTAAQAATGDTL